MRTRRHLLGESSPASNQQLAQLRAELRRSCKSSEQSDWWERILEELPSSYLLTTPKDQLFTELERLRQLPHNDVAAWSQYLPEHRASEYSVGTYEQITPGIFHKLTGALTSKGLQILSAEIHTLAGELVLDRFYVNDLDFAKEPPPARREEILQALIKALKDPGDAQPTFRRLWQPQDATSPNAPKLPTQVRIDDSTSDRFTIIDVFAHDRRGLLYAIARTIFELGLSVHVAKIGTHLDQVVDVFYVTEKSGLKVLDGSRRETIRERLLLALEQAPQL
jgi:[protein-PII] uridylyltransferase